MANKKNDPNHLGFGRLMAWKSSDIAMAGLNVIVLGYLSIYCSDTLGIAPAVVGTVLMVSKSSTLLRIFLRAGWSITPIPSWARAAPMSLPLSALCSALWACSPAALHGATR